MGVKDGEREAGLKGNRRRWRGRICAQRIGEGTGGLVHHLLK